MFLLHEQSSKAAATTMITEIIMKDVQENAFRYNT